MSKTTTRHKITDDTFSLKDLDEVIERCLSRAVNIKDLSRIEILKSGAVVGYDKNGEIRWMAGAKAMKMAFGDTIESTTERP